MINVNRKLVTLGVNKDHKRVQDRLPVELLPFLAVVGELPLYLCGTIVRRVLQLKEQVVTAYGF